MAMAANANMKVMALMGCGVMLIGLLMVPLYYVIMKYVVEVKSRLRKIFWPSYMKGFRRWGYIFVMLLLTGLVLAPFALIVCLPLIIMIMSMMLSTNGVLQGDPSGLPGGFMWLYYAVYVLTVFVLTFFTVFEMTVAYFMYGSIEAREQERQKAREMKLTGVEV
jgi:preprotein translocase subunit SecE